MWSFSIFFKISTRLILSCSCPKIKNVGFTLHVKCCKSWSWSFLCRCHWVCTYISCVTSGTASKCFFLSVWQAFIILLVMQCSWYLLPSSVGVWSIKLELHCCLQEKNWKIDLLWYCEVGERNRGVVCWCVMVLTLWLPWVNETEFLLTISIQC